MEIFDRGLTVWGLDIESLGQTPEQVLETIVEQLEGDIYRMVLEGLGTIDLVYDIILDADRCIIPNDTLLTYTIDTTFKIYVHILATGRIDENFVMSTAQLQIGQSDCVLFGR